MINHEEILNVSADKFIPEPTTPAGVPTLTTSGTAVTFSANTIVKKEITFAMLHKENVEELLTFIKITRFTLL